MSTSSDIMFHYEPLDPKADSLRVLTLLPRSKGSVACTLENRTFRSKPQFEALSYTWGTKPESTHITINGELFPVRENLYNALQSLQTGKPRALWVDAVCINQKDMAERNAQVSLMAFIYTRAQRVLAWLGPWAEKVQNDYFSDENWYVFSHNSYWRRLWIIQELVLAPEVRFYLGRYEFGWDMVTSTQNPEWRALEGRSEAIHRFREKRYTSAQRLENLIEVFRKAECTEKRDKIYGLLGMVLDGSDSAIKVDYGIGFAQLYAQVIAFHQTSDAPRDSPFPNDVDRAAKLIRFSQLLQNVFEGEVAKEVKSSLDVTWSGLFYTARAYIAGEILKIGPTPSEVASSIRADKSWRLSFSRVFKELDEQQKARSDYEAFSKKMLDWSESYLAGIKKLDSHSSYGFQFVDPGPSPFDEQENKEAEDKPAHSEARLVLGDGGIVGVVPGDAQEGDYICTFLGCNVAVVVRKLETAADRFLVLGLARIQQEQSEWQTEEDDDIEWQTEEDDDIETAIAYDMKGLKIKKGSSSPFLSDAGINLRLDLTSLQKLTSNS
ncbi:unnamed protein product [Clonostachys rosea f. rosea IK726]|uniref:Heterokaryon incompatibility domain-containing protein n=3 Tax=Bionectria ochroleuca TaxID=29856 RepID=A0A8H7N4Y3_BIOOC|nr:unnamed protein product [Clonostachys rosea f. rosea IK726]